MAKVSDKAKLYYIKLCFFANNGFVPNPLSVLDSMGPGYDKSIYKELVDNGEILTIPDRAEVFITSYFVHNHFNPSAWTKTIYFPYWKDKIWTKRNGVATLKKPQNEEEEPKAENTKIEDPSLMKLLEKVEPDNNISEEEVDSLLEEFKDR